MQGSELLLTRHFFECTAHTSVLHKRSILPENDPISTKQAKKI